MLIIFAKNPAANESITRYAVKPTQLLIVLFVTEKSVKVISYFPMFEKRALIIKLTMNDIPIKLNIIFGDLSVINAVR